MASFLESFKKIFSDVHRGNIVGIDIGTSSIKVVELAYNEGDGVTILKNYAEIELGPFSGIEAGKSTNLPPEKLVDALSALMLESGIVLKHTSFAIPLSASLLLLVELPDVGPEKMETMVPIEARRYIPVPLTDVTLDWWALPKRATAPKPEVPVEGESAAASGTIEVMLAALYNEVVSKYETIRQSIQAPKETAHFEIEIFGTLRAVVGSDLEPIVVVDIGASSSKFIFVDEGVVRGSHIVAKGGQDITQALATSRGISFAEAEALKCRVGIEGNGEAQDVAVVADVVISNILNEVSYFIKNYERKYGITIRKVVLVGGTAHLKGVEATIQKGFPGVSVMLGDPFAHIQTPGELSLTLKEIGPKFAVAVGVAIRGLRE